MFVLSIYALTNPPNSTSESVGSSDAFYDQLQSTFSSVPASDLLVIMGDFNAQVGSDCCFWNSVMGPHSIGKCNENGERLLDFCASNYMIVSNTWFQHKLLHQATWFRNSDRCRSGHMIDYVLINKCFHTSVLDTHVYCSTLHESDHELVYILHFKIKVKRRPSRSLHYQTTNLPSSFKASYPSILAETFDISNQTSSLNSAWDTFKFSILKTCKSLLPTPKSPQPLQEETRSFSSLEECTIK